MRKKWREKIEEHESNIKEMAERLKGMAARLVVLECDHKVLEMIDTRWIGPHGHKRCVKCNKTIWSYETELEFRKAKKKLLDEQSKEETCKIAEIESALID